MTDAYTKYSAAALNALIVKGWSIDSAVVLAHEAAVKMIVYSTNNSDNSDEA